MFGFMMLTYIVLGVIAGLAAAILLVVLAVSLFTRRRPPEEP